MLRNEAAHDGAATAMQGNSGDSGLINEVVDSLKDPKILGLAIGAAAATALAVRFGEPIIAKGVEALTGGKTAQPAVDALRNAGINIADSLHMSPATDAATAKVLPVGKHAIGETGILGIETGGKIEPWASSKGDAAFVDTRWITDPQFYISPTLREMRAPSAPHQIIDTSPAIRGIEAYYRQAIQFSPGERANLSGRTAPRIDPKIIEEIARKGSAT